MASYRFFSRILLISIHSTLFSGPAQSHFAACLMCALARVLGPQQGHLKPNNTTFQL